MNVFPPMKQALAIAAMLLLSALFISYLPRAVAQAQAPSGTLPAPTLTARADGAAIELNWTEVPGADRYVLFRLEVDGPGWQQIGGDSLRDTSYTDSELTPGVTYQYAVRAFSSNGQPLAPWSNYPTATVPGSGPPTATPTATPTLGPTLSAPRLSARHAGANAIGLSWTSVPGADRYVLFRLEVDGPGWQQIGGDSLRDTSYTDSELTPGVTYQYAVRAFSSNGQPLAPWSNYPTATVPESGAPTSTPTATATPTLTPTATASTLTAPRLSARHAGANAIDLNWTPVTGADRYVLYRQEVDGPGWQQIGGDSLQDTSYTDSELTPGVTYRYAVRAISSNGQPLAPWSNFPTATIPGSGPPTATPTATPTLGPALTAPRLSARHAGANAIGLSWTSVSGADRYVLFRLEVDGPGWQQIGGDSLQDTSYTDSELTPGVTYRYAVRAISSNGQPLAPWSNYPTATIPESGAPTATPTATSTPTSTPTPRPTLTPTATASSNQADRTALIALYNATNGPHWYENTNWLTDRPLAFWYGVRTDSSGRVTHLDLNNNNLRGSIPAELGNLASLENLWLDSNSLRGSIPAELGNLANLKDLRLHDTRLSGAIPSELGNLANLRYLVLSYTRLSGAIPKELGKLSKLKVLNLNSNFDSSGKLSGSIPAELGNLANLTTLHLVGNELSGSIPAELGKLTNLRDLLLHGNRLSGSIPAELGNLANLDQRLALDNNRLSGSIPAELGNLANLDMLSLSSNELSGPIPSQLGNLANLRNLDLINNRLSGSIPAELGNLTNLVWLYLNDNELSGSIPARLGNLAHLVALRIDNNRLSGCVPAVWREVPNQNLGGLPYCS